MSFLCFKKTNNTLIRNAHNEIYLFEIQILDDFLRPCSQFDSTRNAYFTRDYTLKLTNPLLNINQSNDDKYYLCYNHETKEYGFKKPNSFFIKIFEFDEKTGFYNEKYPKLKIILFTLMIENDFIEFIDNIDIEETY